EPLDYKLKNGDIVEVMTSKHSYGPSQDWLNITQSSQAKNKIRQYFKKQRREENIVKGKEQVEREIRFYDIEPKDVLTADNMQNILDKFNFVTEDDLYAAVGYQGITAASIATRLTEDIRRDQKQQKAIQEALDNSMHSYRPERLSTKENSGIKVEGVDNLLVRLSKCCNPVPGDKVVGYITKGRGVSVHRANCPNVQTEEAKKRYIEVKWLDDESASELYDIDLEITGYDRRG